MRSICLLHNIRIKIYIIDIIFILLIVDKFYFLDHKGLHSGLEWEMFQKLLGKVYVPTTPPDHYPPFPPYVPYVDPKGTEVQGMSGSTVISSGDKINFIVS